MASLPPGFRFHPTDVELIMYYLKRKIMGKKLLFDAITELNIYKFSPWDLPEKCCYKSKDLEWYFFCPREKKYASGARMNRATETGYWKTTGKDRSVIYDEKVVGSVKTLIFHQGHPPRGQRTDWVIHEYKFEDKGLADAGFTQDSYVLCKVFQKSGLGPKNGAQYGAPFKESDWEDDEVPAEPCTSDVLPAPPGLPENQCYSIVTNVVNPGSTSGWPSSEPTRTSIQKISSNERGDEGVLDEPIPPNVSSVCRIPLDEPDVGELPAEPIPSSFFSALAELRGKHTFPFGTGMINPGPGPDPSSAQHFTSEMPLDEQDDEIIGLLAHFREDPFLPTAGNENNQNLENFNQDINAPTLPFTGENDIYDGLGDISNWAGQGQSSSNFSASDGANYSLNPMILPEDASYMELNDLDAPLNNSTGTIETGQLGLGNFGAPYNSNNDLRQLCFGSNSLGIDHALENQLSMLPESYTEQVNRLDMVYNFQNNVYQGCDAATNISFSSYKRPEDNRFAARNLERGAHQRKFYSSIFALSGSLCGGTFILVKAEVTLGIGCTYDALSAIQRKFYSSIFALSGSLSGGTFILVKAEVALGIGCTYDALSAILGDPCVTLIYQSSIDKPDEFLKKVNGAFCFGFSFAFICFFRLKRLWFYTFWILNDFIHLKILLIQMFLFSSQAYLLDFGCIVL